MPDIDSEDVTTKTASSRAPTQGPYIRVVPKLPLPTHDLDPGISVTTLESFNKACESRLQTSQDPQLSIDKHLRELTGYCESVLPREFSDRVTQLANFLKDRFWFSQHEFDEDPMCLIWPFMTRFGSAADSRKSLFARGKELLLESSFFKSQSQEVRHKLQTEWLEGKVVSEHPAIEYLLSSRALAETMNSELCPALEKACTENGGNDGFPEEWWCVESGVPVAHVEAAQYYEVSLDTYMSRWREQNAWYEDVKSGKIKTEDSFPRFVFPKDGTPVAQAAEARPT